MNLGGFIDLSQAAAARLDETVTAINRLAAAIEARNDLEHGPECIERDPTSEPPL